jgi:hypothetical protein
MKLKNLTTTCFAMIILTVSIFVGCGPSQTAAERDDDNIRAEFDRRQEILRPLVGNYLGTLTNERGLVSRGLLSIHEATMQVTVPGRGQSQPVATLEGTYALCTDQPDRIDSRCSRNSIWTTFNQANYIPGTGKVKLFGSASGSQSSGATSSFELTFRNGTLFGSLETSGRSAGYLELKKVD